MSDMLQLVANQQITDAELEGAINLLDLLVVQIRQAKAYRT